MQLQQFYTEQVTQKKKSKPNLPDHHHDGEVYRFSEMKEYLSRTMQTES